MSFDSKLFDNAAMGIFKGAHPDLIIPHEQIWNEVLTLFKVNDLSTAGEEIARFSEWVRGWKLQVQEADIDGITVGIQVKANDGYINLQLRGTFPFTAEGGSTADQRSINATTTAFLTRLFTTLEHLQRSGAITTTSAQQQNTQASQNSGASGAANGGSERHMGETMVVNIQNGKRQYRIKGGWFQQWGAAVYEEVLLQAGITPEALPSTATPFNRYIHVIRDSQGRPKVTKIE